MESTHSIEAHIVFCSGRFDLISLTTVILQCSDSSLTFYWNYSSMMS